MAKYEEGSYHIRGFDRYGSKIFERKAEAQSSEGSKAEGNKLEEAGEIDSFITFRVQFNSKDKTELWLPRKK